MNGIKEVPAVTPETLALLTVTVEQLPEGVTVLGATMSVKNSPRTKSPDAGNLDAHLKSAAQVLDANVIGVDWQGGEVNKNYVIEFLVAFSDGYEEPYQIELPVRRFL